MMWFLLIVSVCAIIFGFRWGFVEISKYRAEDAMTGVCIGILISVTPVGVMGLIYSVLSLVIGG